MSNRVTTLTTHSFAEEVLAQTEPVVVDFWAPWCGPCRAIAPAIDELARQFAGRVKIAKLNVDEFADTAKEYGIRNIPTVVIFRDGEVVERIQGLVPKSQLAEKVAAQIARVH